MAGYREEGRGSGAALRRNGCRQWGLPLLVTLLLGIPLFGLQGCRESRAEEHQAPAADVEHAPGRLEEGQADPNQDIVPEWQRYRKEQKEKEPVEYPVPPPPFSYGIFPCSDCHADMEVNYQVRELEDEHEDIKLNHGPRDRWCFDCHNPENRDVLRLASGKTIPFTESYRLCGQCHGPKFRDWKAGVHGKRTGRWDGRKEYLLCPHCHNPHAPRFPPIAPKPPPPRPSDMR